MTPRRSGRRPPPAADNRWLVPALLLFVALPVGFAVFQAIGASDGADGLEEAREDRAGSTSLGRSAAPLLPTRVPRSYEIHYVSTDTARDPVAVSNEIRQVRRPFHARVTTREGAEPGRGKVLGQRISNDTTLATAGADGKWLVLEVGPTLATGDLRFGPALDRALAEGDVVARERRRVGGRTCQVFRAGSSLQAGSLTPYERGSSSYADVCIDDAGLVIEEVWVLDGKRVQRRLATAVREENDLDDGLFTLPTEAARLSVQEGGGSATALTLDSRPPGPFYELPEPARPPGFELVGRFALITPRLEVMRDPTNQSQPSSTTSVATVYVNGPDVLVVDQGTLTGSATLPEAPTSRDVDLGLVGQGTAFSVFRTNEVRARRGGDYLRIYGTLALEQLLEVTRSLTVTEGGTLTPRPADP